MLVPFLIILMGVFDLGRAIYMMNTTAEAAREISRRYDVDLSELLDKLASLQKEDGSWSGDKRWMEDHPVIVTSYCVMALHEITDDLAQHPAK